MAFKSLMDSILITGGSGMVGSQADFGKKPSRKELDILNSISIIRAFDRHKPSIVLHLAAMTDMAECEMYPERAYAVNVIGTYNVARACRERNIRLVYLSTGAVFDGKKHGGYCETDEPHPLNTYGRTKRLGEVIAQDLIKNALIIRTGWLFGGGVGIDKKFVELCLEKFKRNQIVGATFDRWGCPTYIPDLLETISQLLDNNERGIVHVVNEGKASYFEIAKSVRELGGFTSKINPAKAEEIEHPFIKRGEIEVLTSKKTHLRTWREALREYIQSSTRF